MDERARMPWTWLFPLAQALHAAEELLQGYGFHGWLRSFRGAEASPPDLLLLHGAFAVAMAIAVAAAPRARWIVPALAVLVLLNALVHVAAALLSSGRTSGLVTALALWVPLGAFALRHSARHLRRRQLVTGCIAGAVVQVPLSWLAYTAGG